MDEYWVFYLFGFYFLLFASSHGRGEHSGALFRSHSGGSARLGSAAWPMRRIVPPPPPDPEAPGAVVSSQHWVCDRPSSLAGRAAKSVLNLGGEIKKKKKRGCDSESESLPGGRAAPAAPPPFPHHHHHHHPCFLGNGRIDMLQCCCCCCWKMASSQEAQPPLLPPPPPEHNLALCLLPALSLRRRASPISYFSFTYLFICRCCCCRRRSPSCRLF